MATRFKHSRMHTGTFMILMLNQSTEVTAEGEAAEQAADSFCAQPQPPPQSGNCGDSGLLALSLGVLWLGMLVSLC